ncbi:MAG: tyrosinase family protein [Pseudomonadota bacterium]
MERRDVLMAAGSIIALGGAGLSFDALADPATSREDIATFSKNPAKVAALRAAFGAMQDRAVDQPVGWFNYAAIHGIYDDDPDGLGKAASLQGYWNQCHRNEGLFFIWHRAYLAALERNLQLLSGRPALRLPYWDWYTQPTLPPVFRDEYLDAARTQKNPLFHPRRQYVADGNPVWIPKSSTAIDQPTFAGLQEMLNDNEHGAIHVNVGGDMGHIPTAARDPIFWLHHCNIDRLFTAWVSRKGNVPDQTGAFDAGGYKFPIEKASDYTPRGVTLDMPSITPLGTGYESLDGPFQHKAPGGRVVRPRATRRIASSTRAIGSNLLALNAPIAVEVPAGGLNIAFALPRRSDSKLNAVFNAVPLAEATSITIHLDQVRLAGSPEGLSGFDVFVGLPEGATDNAEPLKVGTISVFGLTMRHTMDGRTMMMAKDFRFSATRQFRGPAIRGSDLLVSLVANLAPGADVSPKTPTLSIGDARVEVSAAPIE